MKNPFKSVKAALAQVQPAPRNVVRTSLEKFNPPASGSPLQIGVAMISGTTIEVHYQPRVR